MKLNTNTLFRPFWLPIISFASPVINITQLLLSVALALIRIFIPLGFGSLLIAGVILIDSNGATYDELEAFRFFLYIGLAGLALWVFQVTYNIISSIGGTFLEFTLIGSVIHKKIKLFADIIRVMRDVPFGICNIRHPQTDFVPDVHRLNARSKNISQMTFPATLEDGSKEVITFDEFARRILFYENKLTVQKALVQQLEGLKMNTKTTFIDCTTMHGRVMNYRFLRDVLGWLP